MRPGNIEKTVLVVFAAVLVSGVASAQTITATQVDGKTIRVVAPGKFETDFSLRKGFGTTWFDLKHDPDKKFDLAPVAQENGFFWIKNGLPQGVKEGSYYANPAKEMELLEKGPVRVRVRLKGKHMRYGYTSAKAAWNELGFELTWTVYPTGHVFGDYTLIAEKPVKLHHMNAIIKSTGHWGPSGKGVGANEAHCTSEAGEKRPSKWTNKGAMTSFALQWTNGPTHFTDILMAFQKGKYYGSYWHGGYKDKDYRAGLNIIGLFKGATVPAGRTHVPVMFRIAEDMNDAKTAALYANDYRTPDKPKIVRGDLISKDAGDYDSDGFNESEGCYVFEAVPQLAFTLHGKETPRMSPVFKIHTWKGDAPKTITLGEKKLTAGKDFNAAVKDEILLLQILQNVKTNVEVGIK